MHPQTPSYPNQETRSQVHSALAMGVIGAIIGGSTAVARNIREDKKEDGAKKQIAKDVSCEMAGTALAAAAASTVIGGLRSSGLLSFVGFAAVATGTKYAWDATVKKTVAAPAEK